MRATLYTIILAGMLVLTVVPATASADFHPVCEPPVAAYANVELHTPPGDTGPFTYSGGAYCPSAEIEITELELIHIPDYGVPSQVANTTAGPCASTTTNPCTATDTAPAGAGTFLVRMTFDVDDPATPGVDFPDVVREGLFEYLGVGQPIPLCVSAGVIPQQIGTCTI